MEIKEDDIVRCKVTSIQGATVFLEIEGNGKGMMTMSEVAAGRIRNLREYVFPNKQIICKVLYVSDGHPQLSLRRVTGKEKEEAEKRQKKEKIFRGLLKTITKEPAAMLKEIESKQRLFEFIEEIQIDPKILNNFLNKDEAQRLSELLKKREETERKVKKIITLKTLSESGIEDMQEILQAKDVEISYLGSSQFSISLIDKNFKEANVKLNKILEGIEEKAKEKKATLEIKER